MLKYNPLGYHKSARHVLENMIHQDYFNCLSYRIKTKLSYSQGQQDIKFQSPFIKLKTKRWVESQRTESKFLALFNHIFFHNIITLLVWVASAWWQILFRWQSPSAGKEYTFIPSYTNLFHVDNIAVKM